MRRTVLVLASVALAVLFISAITGSPPPAAQTTPTKPNFVFILTDDMRKDDLAYMPNTRDLIASQGMTFENAYVPLASCCPSRASILRGQYVHNHKVWYSNKDSPIGGYQGWVSPGHESDNLATRLQAGGYSTGLFGKYMNGYAKTTGKPLGWTDWFAMNSDTGYFNYSVNDNGIDKNFGSTASDYMMDVLNTESQQFIQNSVTAGKPFFLYLSPHVPHLPSTPAPRHVNAFNGEPAPRLDSYNEDDVSDKPPWIRSLPKISSTEAATIQQRHEKRVESLQSVDEAVEDIVTKLSATQPEQLSNTYIVFTSDNGWQHGEHRIPSHKYRPYEESSHMPLLIRGPGVATGSSDKLVTFPDFMPTFLELAGIAQSSWPSYIDGRSLLPLLNGTASSWRTAVLLEGRQFGSPEQDYFAIRTADGVKYIEYASGFKEYYNLSTDPNEMTSTPGSAPASLVDRLQRLKTCAAATCRSIENEGGGTPPPPPPPDDTTDPQITITTPPQGAAYTLGQSVAASYECTDADSGVASCQGSVTNGANIDTSSTGTKTFSVVATDNVGNTNTVSHTYTVNAPTTSCTKSGTSNSETISGTSGDDVICGLGGNDILKGLGGNDTLRGAGGNDTLQGGVGNDTLDGGTGTDTASYSASLTAVSASLATLSSTGEGSDTFVVGVENLLGSSNADTLTGSETNNTLTGGGGNDQLIGNAGADNLSGSGANDTVNSKDGVSGNDTLNGGTGTDTRVTDATERSITGFP